MIYALDTNAIIDLLNKEVAVVQRFNNNQFELCKEDEQK